MENRKWENIKKIGNMENLKNVKEDNRIEEIIVKNSKKLVLREKQKFKLKSIFLNGNKKGEKWLIFGKIVK